MSKWDTVAIVGVGLIGGSIGLALRRRKLAKHVVGIGRRQATLRIARKVGAITASALSIARGVANADLIVVCTPVGRIVEHIQQAAAACPAGALITDAGSIKLPIVEQLNGSLAEGAQFVGSHPLAGSEKRGPAEARDDLFIKRTVVVTPTEKSNPKAVKRISGFWSGLGAKVVKMPAAEHDRVLAVTSHVPHLVAAALAVATPEACLPMAAGGWRDTTRVAAGDPELWQQILLGNSENVIAALSGVEEVISVLRSAIERGSEAEVRQILRVAKQKRDALGS